MSDERFLARWSRRKRAAARPTAPPAAEPPPPEVAPPIDPADLPPLDAIGPESDVSRFLAAGVPPDLARAALRRAWSADPAIRDFVGLAENSGDLMAPGGALGFGSIAPEEVERLLGQALGAPAAAPAPAPTEGPLPEAGSARTERVARAPEAPTEPEHAQEANAAEQHEPENARAEMPRPSHGGALPK